MDAERIAEIRDTLAEWNALTEPGDPAHFCLAAKLLASLPGLIEACDAATKRAEAAVDQKIKELEDAIKRMEGMVPYIFLGMEGSP